jgi:uncharacterized membrane protein YdfJ with MMPL/SSD domain
MLLLIDIFSINKRRRYENPSLEIIVTERCSTGGCPLEEACEHCYLNQSGISVAISYIISVYCEDYAGYFTVILSFLAFHFCSAYFIYLVSCRSIMVRITKSNRKDYSVKKGPKPQRSIIPMKNRRDIMFKIKYLLQNCRDIMFKIKYLFQNWQDVDKHFFYYN